MNGDDDLRRFEVGMQRRRRIVLGVICVLGALAISVVAWATRSVGRSMQRPDIEEMDPATLTDEERAAIEEVGRAAQQRGDYQANAVLAVPGVECAEGMIAFPEGTAVPAFCLDGADVPIGDFLDCVDAGKCPEFVVDRLCPPMRGAARDAPVECVDRAPSEAYCRSIGKAYMTDGQFLRAVDLLGLDVNLRCTTEPGREPARTAGGACALGLLAIPAGDGVDAFCLDGVDVTAGQFDDCIDAGKCQEMISQGCPRAHEERRNTPVKCIDGTPQEEYCRWVGRRYASFYEWERALAVAGPDLGFRCKH